MGLYAIEPVPVAANWSAISRWESSPANRKIDWTNIFPRRVPSGLAANNDLWQNACCGTRSTTGSSAGSEKLTQGQSNIAVATLVRH